MVVMIGSVSAVSSEQYILKDINLLYNNEYQLYIKGSIEDTLGNLYKNSTIVFTELNNGQFPNVSIWINNIKHYKGYLQGKVEYIPASSGGFIGNSDHRFNFEGTFWGGDSSDDFIFGSIRGNIIAGEELSSTGWVGYFSDIESDIRFNVVIEEEYYGERITTLETEQEIQKNKISALELWKETITTQLSDILSLITGLVTRVEVLEETPCSECNETTTETGAGTWDNFKDYITSSTRKKMVCGYAEENRLDNISELGYDCDLTYKTYSSSRERVSCKCKKI